MMFFLHTAYALELLTLLAAVGLWIWALRNEGRGVMLGKIFGITVFIFSLLSIACTAYYATTYWKQGYFSTMHHGMKGKACHRMMMQKKGMMKHDRMNGSREAMPPRDNLKSE